MDIIKIVAVALIAVVLSLLLKNTRPEFALLIEICAGVVIVLLITQKLLTVYNIIGDFVGKANFDKTYFLILIKIVGIAYLAEFGIGFCKDANQSAIASKIELSAKILILIVALPIMSGLIDVITKIIR